MPEAEPPLLIRREHPWNAEPELTELIQYEYTPQRLMYGRNHSPIKEINPHTFTLAINGLVMNKLEYTLAEILHDFSKVEVVAALQCAGNRRKKMAEVTHRDVAGVLWGEGTICNARWGGVRLSNLLLHAGVNISNDDSDDDKFHVCFGSHVAQCEDDDWYGSSIPITKALDPDGDVLLAYEVNGDPLAPEHGYPFRIVVPGYSGVRWVKWVDRITVSPEESTNFYQKKDYKVLPPNVTTREQANNESWWSKIPPLQANSLNSVVALAEVVNSTLYIKGYAVPGPNGQVSRVEVSIDEGKTWRPTRIIYQEGRWSWTLWEGRLDISEAIRVGKVWSRAVDETGNVQPIEVDWNLRGVAYAGVGEREVRT